MYPETNHKQNGNFANQESLDMEKMMQAMFKEFARQQQKNGRHTNENGDAPEAVPEKEKAILKQRAQALAQISTETVEEMTQVVVFKLASETYGIPTEYVREVQPLQKISPVPCVPKFVIGIINIRGAIYSVIDVRRFLGAPPHERTAKTKVLLVSGAGLDVGILADDVLGEISIPQAEIKSPLATRAGLKEEYIEGVTRDMLSILNLEALLSDESIIVHEEVG